MSDLKQATKKALIWSFIDRFWQQAFFIVVAIFTGRLIPEDDFGLRGSLLIFTSIATILSDSGLSMALIRKTNVSERDYSTAFYFNIVTAATLFTLLFLSAPLLEKFYNEPRIGAVAQVLFVTIIFNALGSIQSTILVKKMDFKRLMIANSTAAVCSGTTSVAMAFAGFGVWALVAQGVILSLVKTVMLWILCRWVPKEGFSMQAFREMFGFSSKLLITSLINSAYTNFYSSVIGRYFDMRQAGLYSQANTIKEVGAGSIVGVFGSSTYSMLANVQDDGERRKRAMRKTVRTISFVAFPVMLGIALVAEPMIRVLITERWLPSVPFVQVLCVGALFYILNTINGNFIKINGRSGVLMRLEIVGVAMLIAFLFATIRYGLLIAVCADSISKIILFALYARATSKLMGYKAMEQIKDIAPYAGISLAMVILLYPLKYIITNDILLLLAQAGGGVLFYYVVNRLFGSRIMEEVMEIIKKKKSVE